MQHAASGVIANLASPEGQYRRRGRRYLHVDRESRLAPNSTTSLLATLGNNVLTGLGGNDYLNGGAGADWMFGGTGDDTYVVDNAGDVVDETGGDGIDLVQSSISFSLGRYGARRG